MYRIILQRFESTDQGTFGMIRVGNDNFVTGELPWRENSKNMSCIPPGLYTCKMTISSRFKKFLYSVIGVNNRDGIKIHSANLMGDKTLGYKSQLSGCISIGESIGAIEGQKAILYSKTAIRRFENLMNRKPFILEVQNGF